VQDNEREPAAKNGHAGQDGKKAMAEYEARAIAVREKTERLRALRLAREAAEGPTVAKRAAARSTPVKRKPAGKGKATSATLAAWLEDQQKSGRRT